VTRVEWKLALVRLETMLISAQDRYTVCAECTMGIEIFLGVPDGTPRSWVKWKFISEHKIGAQFGDCVNLDTR
jgi:hypothetical protein